MHMMNNIYMLVGLLGCILLYRVASTMVFAAGAGARKDVLQFGQKLLTRDDIPDDHRKLVENMLDDVFSPWFLYASAVVMPILAVFMCLLDSLKPSREDDAIEQILADPDFRSLMKAHRKATSYTSIIGYALYALSLIFVTLLLAIRIIVERSAFSAIDIFVYKMVRVIAPMVGSKISWFGSFHLRSTT